MVSEWIDSLLAERRLSPGTQSVLKAIVANPELASYCSAAELAQVAKVNVATVVRAAQAIDFSGWSELSTEIRNRFLSSLNPRRHFERNLQRQVNTSLHSLYKDLELMRILSESLQNDLIVRAVDRIAHATTTTVLATGSYIAPATVLSHNSQGIGFNVNLASGSLTSMINSIRFLSKNDCVVAFSIWKTSTHLYQLCEIAKERGVAIVIIADHRSYLAQLADELILVPSEGVGPMASVTCAISIVQCIVDGLANRNAERSSEMLDELETIWDRTGAVVSD